MCLFTFFNQVLAFRDIDPQAPSHVIIIPKVKDNLIGLSKVSHPFQLLYFFPPLLGVSHLQERKGREASLWKLCDRKY